MLFDSNPAWGLRDVAERLAAGPAVIAYLGNSVTTQRDGYRPQLHAGLIARFGHAHRAVNAGFGAVGSIGCVATMDDLVCRHRPVLCFIECLTGDIGVGLHADTGPALEGMLRKLSAVDCRACFLNLPRRDLVYSLDDPIVALYARVSRYYGTPAIGLGQEFAEVGSGLFRDEVHLSASGARLASGQILAALDRSFMAPAAPQPSQLLFARDYSAVRIISADAAIVAGPGTPGGGLFKLTYPYVDIGPDNEIRYRSETHEVLGVLLVLGPDSEFVAINGATHQLRDRWSSAYDRLHAYVFDRPFAAGTQIALAPPTELPGATAPVRLKIIGFLARPV